MALVECILYKRPISPSNSTKNSLIDNAKKLCNLLSHKLKAISNSAKFC